MRRKLRRRSGFTLAETLITIAILALVTAAGTAGVTAVLNVRNRMIQLSNAQMLASTAAEAIADELRFGRNIKVNVLAGTTEGPSVTMNSSLFDTDSTLRLSKGSGEYTTPAGRAVPAGRLVVEREEAGPGGGTAAKHLREVLGASSYHDLQFSRLEFTLTPAAPAVGAVPAAEATVAVTLTVADEGGRDLWSAEFTIVPLNGASGT